MRATLSLFAVMGILLLLGPACDTGSDNLTLNHNLTVTWTNLEPNQPLEVSFENDPVDFMEYETYRDMKYALTCSVVNLANSYIKVTGVELHECLPPMNLTCQECGGDDDCTGPGKSFGLNDKCVQLEGSDKKYCSRNCGPNFMGGHPCPDKYECKDVARGEDVFQLCVPKLGTCECVRDGALEAMKRGCIQEEACEDANTSFRVGYQQCWEVTDSEGTASYVWSACMTDQCFSGDHPYDCDGDWVEDIGQYVPTVEINGYIAAPKSENKTLIFTKVLEGARDLKPDKIIRMGYDYDRTDLVDKGIYNTDGNKTLNSFVLADKPVFVPRIEAKASGRIKKLHMDVSFEFFASSNAEECQNP